MLIFKFYLIERKGQKDLYVSISAVLTTITIIIIIMVVVVVTLKVIAKAMASPMASSVAILAFSLHASFIL